MYQHEPNSERWNPTHSIASILISIVSLLADPNPNSIANVDAAVSFRKWRETKDPNSLFIQRVKYSAHLLLKVKLSDYPIVSLLFAGRS